MPNTNAFGGKTMIYCEQCGEQEIEVTLKHAGLCGDCTGNDLREEFSDVFSHKICGQPIFDDRGLASICVRAFGVEHDHG